MTRWLANHARALRDALDRLRHPLIPTALSVIVIGSALALPLLLHLAARNVATLSGQLDAEPQLTLFLDTNATATETEAIARLLARHPAASTVRFVTRAEALADLRTSAGLGGSVDDLGRNPLPDAFVVTGREGDPTGLETLRDEAASWPKVEHAQLDALWARKLAATVRVGRVAALLLASLLGIALTAVTFNTIRLQILGRRDEIELSKLIGATDAFIRRPFLYFGLLLGAGGGLAGLGMVALAVAILNRQLSGALLLLGGVGGFSGPALGDAVAVVGVAAVLGWLGAALSVGRHLRGFEPL